MTGAGVVVWTVGYVPGGGVPSRRSHRSDGGADVNRIVAVRAQTVILLIHGGRRGTNRLWGFQRIRSPLVQRRHRVRGRYLAVVTLVKQHVRLLVKNLRAAHPSNAGVVAQVPLVVVVFGGAVEVIR